MDVSLSSNLEDDASYVCLVVLASDATQMILHTSMNLYEYD